MSAAILIDLNSLMIAIIVFSIITFVYYQYTQIKPKLMEALDSVGKVESTFNEKADALNDTLKTSTEALQEQVQEHVDYMMDEMKISMAKAQEQVNAHVEAMQDQFSQHVKQVKASLETQVVSVNNNLKESIGEVKKSIDEASTTGPVSQVVAAAKSWSDPIGIMIIVTGAGILCRQIYVKYVKEKDGKEGIEKLSQSKILTLFDALLAMLIVPTLATSGWATATKLWKAARTTIDAIRTIVTGLTLYQSLFGDDIGSKTIPPIDKNFERAIEMVELRVDAQLEKGVKEGKANGKKGVPTPQKIRTMVHVEDVYQISGFHCCAGCYEDDTKSHLSDCSWSPTQQWCGCQQKINRDYPLLMKRNGVKFILNGYYHYETCVLASSLYSEIEINHRQHYRALADLVKNYKGPPKCGCYTTIGGAHLLKTSEKYMLDEKVNESSSSESDARANTRKGLKMLWDKIEDFKEGKQIAGIGFNMDDSKEDTHSHISKEELDHAQHEAATSMRGLEAAIQEQIDKHKQKTIDQVIVDEFDLPEDGLGSKVKYMFNYVTRHPHLLPVLIVVIFAMLLIVSWAITPAKPKKKWYDHDEKIKNYVDKARKKYKQGEDVTAEDAKLSAWANKEGKASDARRAAARLLKTASTKQKRPWWDYDDERDFEDDDTLYGQDEDDMDQDDDDKHTDDEDFSIVDQVEDAMLADDNTLHAIQKKYGKDEVERYMTTEEVEDKIRLRQRAIDAEQKPILEIALSSTAKPFVPSEENLSTKPEEKNVTAESSKIETATLNTATSVPVEATAPVSASVTVESTPPVQSVAVEKTVPTTKKEEVPCPAKTMGGCTVHHHGKVPCFFNIKACPHANCFRKHTPCSIDKHNVCQNKDHKHVPLYKKPKVVTFNLKKEAQHNGDRMVLTVPMLNSIGWAQFKKKGYELNATKIWTGCYVSAHIFGEEKPDPEDEVIVEFKDNDNKIVEYKLLYKKAKHIGYDSLYWDLPFIQKDFKNKSQEPKIGQKITMVAYDSREDFVNGKPRLDVSVLADITNFQDTDNSGFNGDYKRCTTKNSTKAGNCAGPYYNPHGYVVGFHNAKLQTRNIFVGVDPEMVKRATGNSGSRAF